MTLDGLLIKRLRRQTVCAALFFCILRFNSLIISFATPKVRYEQNYIQDVALRER